MGETYRFRCIEINPNSMIVKTEQVNNPNKGRDYVTHWHLLSDEDFEFRLKDLERAIRSFRKKRLEEAEAWDEVQV